MKMSRWSVLALVLMCFSASMFADDKMKKESKPADKMPAAASADEKAMHEAWMKAATPGDSHKKLEAFVGTFDVKTKSWMQPGAPAMESTGTSEQTWILGGRFVESRFKGTFMDQPFEGIGYTGYDNVKKEYFGTWMDNMGTGMMVSTGNMQGDKEMKFEGSMADPMTGKDTKVLEKITIASNDRHTMEMWYPGPDGKMYKMMEIEYTRKK